MQAVSRMSVVLGMAIDSCFTFLIFFIYEYFHPWSGCGGLIKSLCSFFFSNFLFFFFIPRENLKKGDKKMVMRY